MKIICKIGPLIVSVVGISQNINIAAPQLAKVKNRASGINSRGE
jgi:hypothetical protein